MTKFKTGDRVIRQVEQGIYDGWVCKGEIGTITAYDSTSSLGYEYYSVTWDNCALGSSCSFDGRAFTKILNQSGTKPKKEEPKDYHLILKKSCMSYERVCNSYKEAVKYLEDKMINDEYLIFKMTEIGLASPSIKIKKTIISKKKK